MGSLLVLYSATRNNVTHVLFNRILSKNTTAIVNGKQICNVDEIEGRQTCNVDEIEGRQTCNVDEIEGRQTCNVVEIKYTVFKRVYIFITFICSNVSFDLFQIYKKTRTEHKLVFA